MSWNGSNWFKASGGGNWLGNFGVVVAAVSAGIYRWMRRIRRGK